MASDPLAGTMRRPTATEQTAGLTKLGSERTAYLYDGPHADLLETFPSPNDSPYVIEHKTTEFTSLCPKTGQPDYAAVRILVVADKLCVETKSLKLYLCSFRNFGSFMEAICNRVYEDLDALMSPRDLIVDFAFGARGGIATSVMRRKLKPGSSELDAVVAAMGEG